MEEFPTHVHPCPINSDVLTRQHEHRSALIWSGDHETSHMLSGMSDSLIHTSMLQEIDDMTAGVLEGPQSSLTQYTSFRRKITRWQSPQRTRSRPLHPGVQGHAELEHGGERERGFGRRERGDIGSYVLPDPFDSPDLDASTFSLGLMSFAPSHLNGACTLYFPPNQFDSPDTDYVQPPPSAGGMLYAPPPPSAIGFLFDAPLPPDTTGSSIPHMPTSCASSSDSDEHGDDPSDDVITTP
ncbi:hypothetical protein M9H77_23969 [Catharanthus roseus]|uniref:Uncharacterized protein n=1 Tax=Catharanthus roseus TaxID=4058 RepID=A0ACC0AV73_CATRO|nr:hypothetical protein M9H77_23969 [Catharanthus roseus]